MVRILFLTFFILVTLHSRENPFFPSVGEVDIPQTSNKVKLSPLFKRSSITLPSSAREILKVTVEYKKLDGAIESKSIKLKNSIDWHLPIFFSQNYSQDKTTPTKQVKNKITDIKYKKIASIKYATFLVSGKSMKIITSDKIIRNFLLVEPHRIVLDFKRDTTMKSYKKKIPNAIFNEVRVGNHSGYYRAVIKLDGLYRYKMSKVSDGYVFKLR